MRQLLKAISPICIIFVFAVVTAQAQSSTGTINSIIIEVDQQVQIPVEYVHVLTRVQLRSPYPDSIEKRGYETLARTVDVLKEAGYEQSDLTVNSGEIQQRGYNDERSFSYTGSISFAIWELDQLDTIRRGLLQAGMNEFNVQSYKNAREDSLYNEAYANAINGARQQARQILSKQNSTVGDILNINEPGRSNFSLGDIREPEIINMTSELALDPVNPLFNKPYYTKAINFDIEFALIKR